MRIRSGPEAELNPLLIFLTDVIRQRDVELGLHFRIARPMPLGEPKQWAVARVVGERSRQRVAFRQIDAEALEPCESSDLYVSNRTLRSTL